MDVARSSDCDDGEKKALLPKTYCTSLTSATESKVERPSGFGTRHTLTILAFFGFVNVYCMRVNLSVALVAMVNSSTDQSNVTSGKECPDINQNNQSNKSDSSVGEFPWDESLQGIILGSFYYGYILTQLPAGRMAEIFGAKILLGTGVLITSVLTLVTPLAARLGVGVFIAVRILEGIGEGVTFPAMHAMLGKWAPYSEMSSLSSFIYSGAMLGTVISMPISGLLCGSGFLGGWPSAFYIFGTIGCLWFILWMIFVSDTPSNHPRISVEERNYITQSIASTDKDIPIPWRSILTSLPLWSIAVVHITASWGFYTLLSCLPMYMNKIQKYDITQDGLLVSLPYLANWISAVLSGILADVLKNNYLSTGATRKLLTTSGLLLSAVPLVLINKAGCDHTIVVVLLVVSLGVGGLVSGGFVVNHLDIAPHFAGTLMGITNGLSTAAGMLAPYVVGVLTDKNQTMHQWQIVFYISAGLYLVGVIVFIIFGSGEVQKWNNPEIEINISRKISQTTETDQKMQ